MPPASSKSLGSGSSARRAGPIGLRCGLALAAAVAAVAFGGASPHAHAGHSPVGLHDLFAGPRPIVTTLRARGERMLRASSWQGRIYTTATGESVAVYVSEAYTDGEAVGQRWADFFASLVHGSELVLLTVYVTSPAYVVDVCGSPYALGCYGGNELVIIGETVAGVPPEEVARHEYGHHIAGNRLNPPWRAIDWGPKRWASAAGVCSRVQRGTAFPGDEDQHYSENPGEGFAEVYRVLNDLKAGVAAPMWQIVSPSFYPDAAALQATEQDVVSPWTAAGVQTFRARFTANGKTIWTVPLATPLDGELTATLALPRGTLYELTLLAGDGRSPVAQGQWSGVGEKRVSAMICGQRSVVLRVTRRGAPGRFSLQVTLA